MRRRRVGSWVRLAVLLVKPPLLLLTRRDWRGASNIPAGGGVVVCSNHLSYADPLTLSHFLYDAGRVPRFLGKASLFDLPVGGRILRGARQIPVHRGTSDAARAYAAAVESVRAGEAVVIYPEATLTRDPALWPMSGKTGAARVALSTGAPVIPVAQWGPQELLPPGARRPRLHRATVRVAAGPPVDLSGLSLPDVPDRRATAAVLREATDRILDAVAEQLSLLRGEPVPPVRHRASGPRCAPEPGPAPTASPEDGTQEASA